MTKQRGYSLKWWVSLALVISPLAHAALVVVSKPAELSAYCDRMAQRAFDQVLADHEAYLKTKPANVPSRSADQKRHEQNYAKQEVKNKCQAITSRSNFAIDKKLADFCQDISLTEPMNRTRSVHGYHNMLECLSSLRGVISDEKYNSCRRPGNSEKVQFDCLWRERDPSWMPTALGDSNLERCEAKVKTLEAELHKYRLRSVTTSEQPGSDPASGALPR